MIPKIYFLDYLSRSGSTLLAKKMSTYKDILVGIEADFIDGIIRGKVDIQSDGELDKYLSKIYKDPKFLGWGIKKNVLKNRLLTFGFPILFNDILRTVLNEYFKNGKAEVYIHKSNFYYRSINKVKKIFPEAKFIFIDRDPRAIFNSQKHANDFLLKKLNWGNIVSFLFAYKKSQKILNIYTSLNFLYIVKYENLITQEEAEMNALLKFLSVKNEKKRGDYNYYEKIPNNQKILHKNLKDEKNIVSRVDAWKKELKNYEIYILQFILHKELKKNNYALEDIFFRTLANKLKTIAILCNFFFTFYPLNLLYSIKSHLRLLNFRN